MVSYTLLRQTAFTGGPRGTLWVSMPIFERYYPLLRQKTKFLCQETLIFPYKIGTFWKIMKIDHFEPPKKVLKHILEGKWSPDVIRERSKLSNDIGHELIREISIFWFFATFFQFRCIVRPKIGFVNQLVMICFGRWW